jgi:hypothetical protein
MTLSPLGTLTCAGPNTEQNQDFPVASAQRLTSLAPTISNNSTNYPHGRAYVAVSLIHSGIPVGNLFAGYPSTYDFPQSFPDRELVAADLIRFRVIWGSKAVAGDQMNLMAEFEPSNPLKAAHPREFNEAPGSGTGEAYNVTVAAPAAGADPAVQTVPAFVRWHLKGWAAKLTTAVAVANRNPALYKDAGAATSTFQVDDLDGTIPASQAPIFAWGVGSFSDVGTAPASGAPLSIALSDAPLNAGDRISIQTTNLQAADQWAAGSYRVEE